MKPQDESTKPVASPRSSTAKPLRKKKPLSGKALTEFADEWQRRTAEALNDPATHDNPDVR